jgi:hypothetical protein
VSVFDDNDGSDETAKLLLVVETPTGARSFMLMLPDANDLVRLVAASGFDAFADRLQDTMHRSETYRVSVGEQEVLRSILETAEEGESPALLVVLAALRGDI